MKVNILQILIFFLFAGLMISCADENNSQVNPGGSPGVHFNMTRASQDIINNTQVYMFDGQGTEQGEFHKKVPGITYSTTGVSMKVESGTWDFALVSAEEDIESNIISPVRGNLRNTAMWTSTPTSDELKSMPELRMGYLAGQQVIANQNNTGGPLDLYRNVAKVRVYIEEANGLNPAGTSTMELTGVPTTINWKGELMPNKVTPATSTKPMKGKFIVGDHPTKTGYQQSQPIEFIIPAHRGTDYLSPTPADTTEQHLTLAVDLALMGGGKNTKNNIIISKVPRINGILEVRLFAGGEVKVTADILNWEDKNINAGISNTVLETDKASVGLAYKDTVYVNTNAASFTFAKDPSASWLTVQRIGNTNALEIIANVDTYVDNSPRDSYFTITANNLTKKIPVQQRPDRGTIYFNDEKLVVSPANASKSTSITSVGGPWKIITTTQKTTTSSSAGNAGTQTVTFTRGETMNDAIFDQVYGDIEIVVKNTLTLDTDTLKLSNLFIFVDDNELLIDHVEHSDVDVDVYGGEQRSVNITTRPSWVYGAPDSYYNNTTNKLHLKATLDPLKEERWGNLTLQHKDDPEYTLDVILFQEIYIDIPEFDYYTVKFTWNTDTDVDIKCGFTGNKMTNALINGQTYNVTVPFDDKFIGYFFNSSVNYGGSTLIEWGGDARDGEGETLYFNAPMINGNPYPGQYGVTPSTSDLLPRKMNLQINAAWYSSVGRPNTIKCRVEAFRGGTVSKNIDGLNYDFSGESVYSEEKTYAVTVTHSTYYWFCTVEYDRKKHTATVTWNPNGQTTRSVPTPIEPKYHESYTEKKVKTTTPKPKNN